MNGIFVIQFLINDFMYIKAEHEKIYINAFVGMSKYHIWPQLECQKRVLNVKIRYSPQFRMSKYDLLPQFECHNRILNVKIRYSAPVLKSK